MKDDCEEAGVDYEKMLADDWREVNRLNCYQWVKFARHLDGYVSNAYWLEDSERKAIVVEQRAEAGVQDAGTLVRHDYKDQLPARELPIQDFARVCNTCFLAQKCPAYEADATCSLASRPGIKDHKGLQQMLFALLETQSERALFGAFAERVSGTPLDQQVSKEMQATVEMAAEIQKILSPRDEVSFKAKGPGLIAKLFGGYGRAGQGPPGQRGASSKVDETEALKQIIDVEPDDGGDV